MDFLVFVLLSAQFVILNGLLYHGFLMDDEFLVLNKIVKVYKGNQNIRFWDINSQETEAWDFQELDQKSAPEAHWFNLTT